MKQIEKQPRIKYEEENNGCWRCVSHKQTKSFNGKFGYFQIMIGSRTDGSRKREWMHRFIYSLYNEEIPKGMVVRHKCDNTYCINPEHLELGTHIDNMNDMKMRGRSAKGESNASAKLTDKQVEEIRNLYGRYTQAELGKMFNVSQRHISNIVRDRSRIN